MPKEKEDSKKEPKPKKDSRGGRKKPADYFD